MASTARLSLSNPLQWITLATTVLLVSPVLYITVLALRGPSAVWNRLWSTRIPELLANTVSLAASVSALTFVMGVGLAWLVVRYEFPGRRFWEWALVLPLAMPTYVLAYVYAHLMSLGGPIDLWWQSKFGPDSHVWSPHGFAGVSMIMALDTFPFVYLLARGALLALNVSYEEVARACGVTPTAALWRVTLPLIRPAVVAGLAMVILYVVSDFGAVSLLRYQTLTYAVYQQMTGRYDHVAASILSVLLVGMALVFLIVERWSRRRSRFYQTTGRYRTPLRRRCSQVGAWAATGVTATVWAASFGIPAGMLVYWSMAAVAQGALDWRFVGFVANSAWLSCLAASCAVVVGLPLAYLASRHPTQLNLLSLQAAYAGYALPGPVAALAVLSLLTAVAPFLYGSVLILIVAYVIHFLPAGLQSLESTIQQVTPNLEEAAKTLGLRTYQTLWRVTFPLIRNGFLAAWVLMFLQTMKELPATLLLRPVGFDTLAIRIWLEASEEYYQLAAPSALLLVVLSLPALLLLVSKNERRSWVQ